MLVLRKKKCHGICIAWFPKSFLFDCEILYLTATVIPCKFSTQTPPPCPFSPTLPQEHNNYAGHTGSYYSWRLHLSLGTAL